MVAFLLGTSIPIVPFPGIGAIIRIPKAAGIVGPFEGSKARQVLVPDLIALEQLLENEKNL